MTCFENEQNQIWSIEICPTLRSLANGNIMLIRKVSWNSYFMATVVLILPITVHAMYSCTTVRIQKSCHKNFSLFVPCQ